MEVWGTTITNDSLLQDDIERKQANHLSDLLRDQAGIDVGGSHSIVQGINIRGVDDLDLNITVDGISQNNNMF
ncbi:MAG TPA: TonB-dependent siderophore receptor, partial [Pseudoalteromonas sp.]|nr:TonB-dependent siderophore receptor [Pseudoalteromonas sp.]